MGEVFSYLGTLAAVVSGCCIIGGLAAVVASFGLHAACWFPHNWSDWQGKIRSKDDEVAEMYVITACVFWARVAFVLGVLYALTEVCRDDAQRLLRPLLRLVNSL